MKPPFRQTKTAADNVVLSAAVLSLKILLISALYQEALCPFLAPNTSLQCKGTHLVQSFLYQSLSLQIPQHCAQSERELAEAVFCRRPDMCDLAGILSSIICLPP